MRLGQALSAFWRTLTDADFAKRLTDATPALPAPEAPAPEPAAPSGPACDGLALLAVLQRDGRLVDFLMEAIDGYDDAQIGAAARAVHAGCREALQRYVELAPVIDGEEGARTTVAAGFDPSAVQLTGKVSGDPPFQGTLQHHGWKVAGVSLPDRPEGQDPSVLAPAEVEL